MFDIKSWVETYNISHGTRVNYCLKARLDCALFITFFLFFLNHLKFKSDSPPTSEISIPLKYEVQHIIFWKLKPLLKPFSINSRSTDNMVDNTEDWSCTADCFEESPIRAIQQRFRKVEVCNSRQEDSVKRLRRRVSDDGHGQWSALGFD